MTVQELTDHGVTAAPYAAAIGGGLFLQYFLPVIQWIGNLFAKKPAVPNDLMAILSALLRKQDIGPQILQLLKDLQDNQLAIVTTMKGLENDGTLVTKSIRREAPENSNP